MKKWIKAQLAKLIISLLSLPQVETLLKKRAIQNVSDDFMFPELKKTVAEIKNKITKKTEDFVRTGLVYSKSRKTWARMGKEHDKDKRTYNLAHPIYTDGITGYRARYPDREITCEKGFGLTSNKLLPFSVEKLVNTLFDMKLFTMVEVEAFKVTVTKSPGVIWSQQIIDQIEDEIFGLIEKEDPSLVPYQEEEIAA